MILKITIFILILLLSGIVLFLKLHPEFGGKPTAIQKKKYQESSNFDGKTFVNQTPTLLSMNFKTAISLIKDYRNKSVQRTPSAKIKVLHPNLHETTNQNISKMVWFGHSAVYLETKGKKIFIDPMLGNSLGPLHFLGSKRFTDELPVEIENLPELDMVILSHDHYDHLDYKTIKKLSGKVKKFIVPLGVSPHLTQWGISEDCIIEMDWWDTVKFEDVNLTCAPSRHFTGRGLGNRNSTLWCSWVIKTPEEQFYFSGDGGYGPHFKEIGDKFGSFDIAFMECGQYDTRWEDIHMLPDQTAQASIDVNAKKVVPIHWGAFTLSLHDWREPVEKISTNLKTTDIEVLTPEIGQIVYLNFENYHQSEWWKNY